MQSVIRLVADGGFVMYPLLLCSGVIWWVILERAWRFRRLNRDLQAFQLQASNVLLRGDTSQLRQLCQSHPDLPTSRLLEFAVDRLQSKDARVRRHWQRALERRRQVENLDLRRHLWMLGTIGSAAPFIGLFGTVVGILRSFGDIASTGKGGFAVVAAGISEALIATAAGIIVAVIAVMAFNAFQTRWAALVLLVRNCTEELRELLEASELGVESGSKNGAQ